MSSRRRVRCWPTWVLCLALGVTLGCRPAAVEEPAADEPVADAAVLHIDQARVHILPGGHGAAYLEIDNGPTEDRLLAIETSIAAEVELHESVETEGVMRMVAHPQGFVVPAAGRLSLQPGGKHAMLMEAVAPSATTTVLTLVFEQAGSVEVSAQVLGVPGADDHGSMDHGSMNHGSMDHGSMDHGTSSDDAAAEADH